LANLDCRSPPKGARRGNNKDCDNNTRDLDDDDDMMIIMISPFGQLGMWAPSSEGCETYPHRPRNIFLIIIIVIIGIYLDDDDKQEARLANLGCGCTNNNNNTFNRVRMYTLMPC
jgi:hypothetical protein